MNMQPMIAGIKTMKYEPEFPNFMGVGRENLLCFLAWTWHENGPEPWSIFVWVVNQTCMEHVEDMLN